MPYIQLPHFLLKVTVEPFAKLDRGVLHLLGLRRPGPQRAAYSFGKHLSETFPIFVQVCGRRHCPTGPRIGLYVYYVSREFPVALRYSGLIVGKYQQGQAG